MTDPYELRSIFKDLESIGLRTPQKSHDFIDGVLDALWAVEHDDWSALFTNAKSRIEDRR